MAISVTASPISVGIAPVPNVTVWAGAIPLVIRPYQPVVTHFPAADRNELYDQSLDASYDYLSEYTTIITIHGSWFNISITADPIEITSSVLGDESFGDVWFGDVIDLILSLGVPYYYGETEYSNVVSWSKIGYLDFSIDRKNSAGNIRMEWGGRVYCLKKLNNSVISYGAGGVTLLAPFKNTYGQKRLLNRGLIGQQAVCGNDFEHYFVDTYGRLWRNADKLESLGYEEYLSCLTSTTILSFDEFNRVIYICDGINGFVYSIDDGSLAYGPINIVNAEGILGPGGVIISDFTTIPPVEIITDIYDMGTRNFKTIYTIEIGTAVTHDLFVGVYYRLNKEDTFSLSNSMIVNKQGIAHIPCYGLEFMFRVFSYDVEAFTIDYITVTGMIHNFSYKGSILEV